jgi:ABC-type transport system involved in cytochrome c biogenesis permease subunit
MPTTPPAIDPLAASSHPILGWLLYLAGGLYALAWFLALLRPAPARWPALLGAALHLAAMIGRGVVIGFFPLTGKMESFSAFALATALVTVAAWQPHRRFVLPLLTLILAGLVTALRFPHDLHYPPPLMWTIWYPLHVPLSFVAYGLWCAAAAAAVAWSKERDRAWLARVDRFALLGFGLWSVSMICGGIWGVVAWGAYFLWDPKVVWSVILWLFYSGFVHLRFWPEGSRPANKSILSLVGLAIVLVAYVGTSFLFRHGSHSFG